MSDSRGHLRHRRHVLSGRDVLDEAAAGGLAIRGGALRTGSFLLAMLMSLVAVPFMTRHLGPVNYGYYAAAFSILFILGGLTEAGLTYLGTREYVTLDARERDPYLRNLVGLRLALTLGGITLAVGVTAATGAATPIVAGVAIAGLGMLLSLTQQTYGVVLSARLQLGWVSILELLRQGVLTCAIVFLVLLGASVVPFFLASVASGAAILLATLLLLREQAALRPSFDLVAWRGVLRRVLPYALAAAVGLIYFRLAVILMSYVSDATETGLYGGAFRIVETVAAIPNVLVSSAFPILARSASTDADRLRYAVGRLLDVSILLGLWSALVVGIGAPFAVSVILGERFEGATAVLRIQSVALLGSFVVATGLFTLLSLERYRVLLLVSTLAALISGVMTFLLAPDLGAQGAAVATVAAELALAIAVIIAIRDAVSPPWATMTRTIPAAAAMLALGVLLDAHSVVLVVLGSVAFWSLALLLRAIPPEILSAVRHRS